LTFSLSLSASKFNNLTTSPSARPHTDSRLCVCISGREKSERRKFVSGLSSLTSDILKVEDLSLEESKIMEDKRRTQGEPSSRRPSRVHRGVQCQFCTCNQDMQRGHRWESSRRPSRVHRGLQRQFSICNLATLEEHRWVLPRRPSRVHRAVQRQFSIYNPAMLGPVQHRWESSSDEAVPQRRTCGTQMEAPVQQERYTQTESPERSCTPPGTPPQLRH